MSAGEDEALHQDHIVHAGRPACQVKRDKFVLYQKTKLWEAQQGGGQDVFTVHCPPYPLDHQQEIDEDEEDDLKNDNDEEEGKTFRFEPRYPS